MVNRVCFSFHMQRRVHLSADQDALLPLRGLPLTRRLHAQRADNRPKPRRIAPRRPDGWPMPSQQCSILPHCSGLLLQAVGLRRRLSLLGTSAPTIQHPQRLFQKVASIKLAPLAPLAGACLPQSTGIGREPWRCRPHLRAVARERDMFLPTIREWQDFALKAQASRLRAPARQLLDLPCETTSFAGGATGKTGPALV